ncbi:DUF4179 domain-containing protein [Sporosarcina beigongshangi]|uniref:DUF4179 domain-containing protein n=1 Tax=Sporosarcina beigongshangi TaxID=2782538 RepID=UPI00193A09DD|nr:DUF4179 domain-containing protein [Sporosarcina beigongshangi]
MTNLNEQDWQRLTGELETIEIPKEALHQARVQALHQHRLTKKRKRYLYATVSVAAIVLLLFATSIRVSPVFAQAVAKIPGFSSIVNMIAYDKGISDIVENNYYEELGVVVTKGDYTLTLQSVVADYSGMTIFYNIKSTFNDPEVRITSLGVSQQGMPWGVASSYIGSLVGGTALRADKVEIRSADELSYDNMSFEFNLHLDDPAETKFAVPFTLTKPIKQPKVYKVNQSVAVDGQTIHIKQLEISPLRAEIRLAADEQNTMQLLKFRSVRLIDENGEDWGQTRDMEEGFGISRDGEISIRMQSNYFRQPKELTLVMERIEALPKDSDYIEIDFEKQKVLYVPSELDIDVQVLSSNIVEVTYPKAVESQLIGKIVNRENNKLNGSLNSGIYSRENGYQKDTYTFNFENELNPLRLHINSYPLYLDGTVEIDIPLDDE